MLHNNNAESKYPTASWREYSPRIIQALELKKTTKGEFHGPCPSCSGVDRFWIKEHNGEVLVHCRKCNDFKQIKDRMRDMSLWPTEVSENTVKVGRTDDIQWPERESTITHPYLESKKLNLNNAIVDGDNLCIPVIDPKGNKVGHQVITNDGKKKFSYKMPVVGNFSVIGGKIIDFAYVAEGWATCASIHEATGKPVVFALNAGNIPAVVGNLMEAKPNCTFVVAGDNDEAGIKACERAQEDHGVEYILPDIEGWDYSDMWLEQGPEKTAEALKIESVLNQVFFPYDAKPQLASNYLMKGWFGEGQMSVIYGPSNVGKSFFVLDIAWHIGANEAWNNNKVNGGSVLYLATEGGMAFHNRVVAMRQHYIDHKDVKLAVRPSPVNMLDADVDMHILSKLCREVARSHGPVKMIIIDTLSRAMSGANENSPEDMTKFIGNCDKLRELTGAHVATVHHSGKDKAAGARGHSSLRAATDTEIELDYNEETGMRFAKATKQRDMETGAIFSFKLKVIELGHDDDGDPVTTCVIEKASAEEIEEANRPQIKGKNQTLLRSVFKQLRSEGLGNPNPSGVGWPEPRMYHCISEETVKDHFIGKCSSVSNPKTSYKQALTSLLSSGHIAINDGFMWFTDNSGKAKQRDQL
jgi:archaellum biogenesis ATPase FlaH